MQEQTKRLLRSDTVRRFVCWLIHLYIRLVYATSRWTVEGADVARWLRAENRPFILAFWHGRLLMIPMAWQRLAPMHMLISGHRDGRIIAAKISRAPIVPVTYATRWRWVLKTWDRFHLPLPWSRGVYLWGEPIVVPPDLADAEIENWRWRIEERMIAQTAEADRRVGREAIAPGTLARDALRAMRRTAPGETP